MVTSFWASLSCLRSPFPVAAAQKRQAPTVKEPKAADGRTELINNWGVGMGKKKERKRNGIYLHTGATKGIPFAILTSEQAQQGMGKNFYD